MLTYLYIHITVFCWNIRREKDTGKNLRVNGRICLTSNGYWGHDIVMYTKDKSLLRYDTVYCGRSVPTFRKILLPVSLKSLHDVISQKIVTYTVLPWEI